MSWLKKIGRLFVIKTRFEAFAIIYALAVGAVGRGFDYLDQYPGPFGYLLFGACCAAVVMAGAKLLDAVARRRGPDEERRGRERRSPASA